MEDVARTTARWFSRPSPRERLARDGTAIDCVGGCGDARSNDKTVANIPILNQVVPHTDYVAQCESSLSSRRAWSIPVTVVGALITVGALVLSGRRGAAANRL